MVLLQPDNFIACELFFDVLEQIRQVVDVEHSLNALASSVELEEAFFEDIGIPDERLHWQINIMAE